MEWFYDNYEVFTIAACHVSVAVAILSSAGGSVCAFEDTTGGPFFEVRAGFPLFPCKGKRRQQPASFSHFIPLTPLPSTSVSSLINDTHTPTRLRRHTRFIFCENFEKTPLIDLTDMDMDGEWSMRINLPK